MNAPMTLAPLRHAGVNLGHGHVKLQTATGFRQYASIARRVNTGDDRQVIAFAPSSAQRVSLHGEQWLVGEDAALSGYGVDRAVFTHWATSEVYAALRQSVWDRLAAESLGPWALVLGMPVAQYHDGAYREALLDSWRGPHPTLHGDLVVHEVAATPEPLGAFWHYVLGSGTAAQRAQESQVLIIDVGFFTTDLSAVHRMHLNTAIGGSLNLGMREVFQAHGRVLQAKYGLCCSDLQVEMAVLGIWPLRVRGAALDFTEELLPAARPVLSEITRWLRAQVDRAQGLILLAGGEAGLLAAPIREAFPAAEVIPVAQPQQANAKGYYHMARHLVG